MDDATRLITDLQVKLAELDNKVAAYRQDLADEFNRYSQELLTNLDPAVSARVQDAVANSLSSYSAISPALTGTAGWSPQSAAISMASIDTVAPTPGLAQSTPAPETPTEASATPAAVPTQTPQSPTPTPTAPTLLPPPPTITAGFYRAESPPHQIDFDAPSPSLIPAPAQPGSSPPVPVAHCPSTSSTLINPDTTTTGSSNNNNTDSTITASAATPSAPAAAAAASHSSADHEGPPPTFGLPRPSTPPPHPSSPSSSSQPTPSPYDPQGIDHMPDSPDDREAELRGVFTPTFLPLVDGSFHRLRSPPTPPRSRSSHRSLTPTTITNLPTMDVAASIAAAAAAGDLDAVDSAASSSPSSVQLPTRPSAGRRATDDVSTSSALSDKSDSKSRRSALRRSSNPTKPQSPRRVRFDVGGNQVLPTSSPSTSLQDVRQHLSGDSSNSYTISGLKEEVDPTTPLSAAVILGLSDLEAREDPPPKKVSSSQALRALSKLPLDSSTVWIPVTQDPDPDADEEDVVIPAAALSKARNSLTSLREADKFRRTPGGSAAKRPPDRVRTLLGAPVQQRGWQEEEEDSDDSSDDDFLSIASKSKAPRRPPASPSPERKVSPAPLAEASATPTSAEASKATADNSQLDSASQKENVAVEFSGAKQKTTEPASGDYEDFDGGDVFDFEVSEGMPKPAPPQVFKPDEEVESEAEDESDQPRGPLNLYSTSPAVDIPPPPPQTPQTSASTSGPAPTSTPALTARFQVQVPTVGSYKGRSITMPVVVNPEVHERAAALGDFNTFVGGLDGRSGMDDGDLSSFRASLSGPLVFSGTPRSLTERFLMEEAMGLGERDNEPVVLK